MQLHKEAFPPLCDIEDPALADRLAALLAGVPGLRLVGATAAVMLLLPVLHWEYRAKVDPDQQHRRNRLLAAMRPQDYALLEPHLQIVLIDEGEYLHLPGEEIEQVYFLHRGIVSLMAISRDGDAISTASVGREGAIGTIGELRARLHASDGADAVSRFTDCDLALPPRRKQERGDQ